MSADLERLKPALKQCSEATSGSMHAWAAALRATPQVGGEVIAREYARPKYELYQELKARGLPTPEFHSFPLSEFQSSSRSYLAALRAERFYVLVETCKTPEHASIYRAGQQRLPEVRTSLLELAKQRRGEELMVTIIEEMKILFDGNVISEKDGSLIGEFSRWNGIPLTRGKAIPDFRISRNSLTGNFSYSQEDAELRALTYKAIRSLPQVLHDGKLAVAPGYYEVQLVAREGVSAPALVVHDFRQGTPFLSES